MTGIEHADDEPLDPPDPLDALLVQCLREPAERRGTKLDELCAQEPQRAAALRRRYAFLCASGLLDLAPGAAPLPERLGGFRLLRRLGEGGMGVVYLAEQESLGRQVALKLIRSELLHSPRARERFRREALAASRLDHPGICAVYEVGEAEGQPFLVMRHVPGRSLAAHLQELRQLRKTPDVAAMVARIEKVARALQAAHAAGLVHRDVKPGNIQLGDHGDPVLLDFGLSQLLANPSEAESAPPAMTATGDVLGTPAYLAPEQIDGRGAVGPATDVYALGVVLYECLTLHPPFAAATRESLYRRILRGEPERANRRNRAVSAELQIVLEVAMDRDPARRYASAGDFADDLARVLAAEPIAARRIAAWLRARRWCQRNPFAATALATLAAGLVAAVLLLSAVQRSARVLQAQNAARRFWELKDRDPCEAVLAALAAQDIASPEADAALRAAQTLAWAEDGFQPREPLNIGCDVDPQHQLAVWVDHRGGGWLWRIGAGEAGVHRFEVQRQFAPQVQFAPDGERFAVAGNDADPVVRLFDREAKPPPQVLGPHPGGVVAVAWHPSKPLLAVGCRNLQREVGSRNAIVVWDVERAVPVREIPQAAWPWNVAFDRKGRILIGTGARHLAWVHQFEGVGEFPVEVWSVDGELLARHVRHTEPVFRMASRDGWLLTGGHDRRAVLWHHDDAAALPVLLEPHEGAVSGVAFASDDTVVTVCLDRFVRRFDRTGALLLSFRLDADPDNVLVVPGSGELVVPCHDGVTRVFAPRGTLLRRFHTQRFGHPGEGVKLLPGRRVLVANAGGRVGIYSLDAENCRHFETASRVIPDAAGTVLAVMRDEPKKLQILRSGREPLHVPLTTRPGGRGISFSPDGRWLAAGCDDGSVIAVDCARDRWQEVHRQHRAADQLRFTGDSRTFATTGRHAFVNVYRCGEDDAWGHEGAFQPDIKPPTIEYCLPLQSTGGELHLLLHTQDGLGIWKWAGKDSTFVHPLVEQKDGPVLAVDASRDGHRLALTRIDRSVQLLTWDGARAEPHAPRLVHDRQPTWCRFDRSGEQIVTIDGDRFAWVWRWDGDRDGKPVTCIRSPADRTFRTAWFSEDGREVITVDDEQRIERWPIAVAGVREELARRWRLLEHPPR